MLETVLRKLGESLVLVEGKRDVLALAQLGVQAIACHARKPERVVNGLVGKEGQVVLLFDFDQEGERKEKEYRELLYAAGIEVDLTLRKAFKAIFGVRTIESAPTALERILKEINKEGGF